MGRRRKPARKDETDPTDDDTPPTKREKKTKQKRTSARIANRPNDAANSHNVSSNGSRTNARIRQFANIFKNAQASEARHATCLTQLAHAYEQMEHGEFMQLLLHGIRTWMLVGTDNPYATNGMKFIAKYLSALRNEDTNEINHRVLREVFEYFLNVTSREVTIRFRICQLINWILQSMNSDDVIDEEMFADVSTYMCGRMKDVSPLVREQAVYALQRLQVPDKPDDEITKIYKFHMVHDPSALVREAVCVAIDYNALTKPTLLNRLWDVDDRVRRRIYRQIVKYPASSLDVKQRWMLLQEGFADRSAILAFLSNTLLPQWLEEHNSEYVKLLSSLNPDGNPEEVQQYVELAKQVLHILFKSASMDMLLNQLPLGSEGSEFSKCIPFEQLTIEATMFWLALIEFVQNSVTDADDEGRLHEVICELSIFCEYLGKYLNFMNDVQAVSPESPAAKEHRFKFYILVEILSKFDLGDAVGADNLKLFVSKTLKTHFFGEKVVEKLIKCVEVLFTDDTTKQQYFIDIVHSILEPITPIDLADPSIAMILNNIKDSNIKMQAFSLKVRIMDLKETQAQLSEQKDYSSLGDVDDELNACWNDFVKTISNCAMIDRSLTALKIDILNELKMKEISNQAKLHCLEICFFSVCSKYTSKLTKNMYTLYTEFIAREMKSMVVAIRNRALKCGIAFAMLYASLVKDVHEELYVQLVRNHNEMIWVTTLQGLAELFDKYGVNHSAFQQDDGEDHGGGVNTANTMHLLSEMFDACDVSSIRMQLIVGYCRWILSGHIDTSELLPKVILRYFDPTEAIEVKQTIGVFFQSLAENFKQQCLEEAMIPTVFGILEAPLNSPLRAIEPDSVLKFIILTTNPSNRPDTAPNLHNKIAKTVLETLEENPEELDLAILFSNQLECLQVDKDDNSLDKLNELTDNMLQEFENSPKVTANLQTFQARIRELGEL